MATVFFVHPNCGSPSSSSVPPCSSRTSINCVTFNACVRPSGYRKGLKNAHNQALGLYSRAIPLQKNDRLSGYPLVLAQARLEETLQIMISGAPASGKGTQCEFIAQKYGVNHISTGDLLRAEVAGGTEKGIQAKDYMQKGLLVPDAIVIEMVKEKLAQTKAQGKGWLLDGYPRTAPQAEALEALGIKPDVFILLDVPDGVLIERVVGRRLDSVTGKVYHLKFSPPENEKVAARLIQRSDDTEPKAKLRLQAYAQNVEALISHYSIYMQKVDGNRPKEVVFEDIDKILGDMLQKKLQGVCLSDTAQRPNGAFSFSRDFMKEKWRGIPTRLNSIPHTREIRHYFYTDACDAARRAVEDGIHKLKVQITILELNPEMDVYRIGTLLELIRELAFTFAADGKRVKVCVQGSMGEGIFSGMPLQLAGTRRMLELMDWGDYEPGGAFINIGSVGASQVSKDDDVFILMAPQNAVANCIINDLQAMVNAAGDRPLIIVNPRLKDLPSAAGVMQIRGREKRMEFAASFFICYNFRLLYTAGTQYPIMGALRMAYPSQYEIYKRADLDDGKEQYILLGTFNEEPGASQISDVFRGRKPTKDSERTGIWNFLFGSF